MSVAHTTALGFAPPRSDSSAFGLHRYHEKSVRRPSAGHIRNEGGSAARHPSCRLAVPA